MVTTMALVWTVNSALSCGCNYVMQWNLAWSVATAKKKTAAHTFHTCLCWNKVLPALRYGTGYHTVWEIRPSAETRSSVHWRRFYFQLTRVHSALELFGRLALQIYLLTNLLTTLLAQSAELKMGKKTNPRPNEHAADWNCLAEKSFPMFVQVFWQKPFNVHLQCCIIIIIIICISIC